MGRLLPAPIAELLQFDLPLNLLLVPMSIVIPPLADGAPHRYQIVSPFHLRHGENDNLCRQKTQTVNPTGFGSVFRGLPRIKFVLIISVCRHRLVWSRTHGSHP